MENIDCVIDSGYSKPIAKLVLPQRNDILKLVARHQVIKTSLAELSQFREGLYKVGKMQEVVSKHSLILKIFYCLNY